MNPVDGSARNFERKQPRVRVRIRRAAVERNNSQRNRRSNLKLCNRREQRASLGIVVWDATQTEISDVVRDADVALYEAKRLGKGRFFNYVPGMHHQAINRFSLVQELRQAVAAHDLAMH